MTEILITGGTGLLGPYLKEAATVLGRVRTCGLKRGDLRCDLTSQDGCRELIAVVQPDFVLHCAAMTNVDACQTEPNRARMLNAVTTENLAAVLPDESKLVFISTDQVYPDTVGPHREDETEPVNVYGSTKLEGEMAALRRHNSLVLRVNFFGPSKTPGRSSLSDWLIAKLAAREPITLFTDSLFSPLHMGTLAQTIVDAVQAQLTGVFNVGCRNGGSKCDFGLGIAAHLGLPSDAATQGPALRLATRTKDLRMDVSRIEEALRRQMPTLQQEIARLSGSN
jgi:dTDP-4-dehydrorhamnose reductase